MNAGTMTLEDVGCGDFDNLKRQINVAVGKCLSLECYLKQFTGEVQGR